MENTTIEQLYASGELKVNEIKRVKEKFTLRCNFCSLDGSKQTCCEEKAVFRGNCAIHFSMLDHLVRNGVRTDRELVMYGYRKEKE